jgi:hypothetical protein
MYGRLIANLIQRQFGIGAPETKERLAVSDIRWLTCIWMFGHNECHHIVQIEPFSNLTRL